MTLDQEKAILLCVEMLTIELKWAMRKSIGDMKGHNRITIRVQGQTGAYGDGAEIEVSHDMNLCE